MLHHYFFLFIEVRTKTVEQADYERTVFQERGLFKTNNENAPVRGRPFFDITGTYKRCKFFLYNLQFTYAFS